MAVPTTPAANARFITALLLVTASQQTSCDCRRVPL
jgi:hypothetical protein